MSLIQQNMGAIYDGSQRLIAPILNSTTATQNWAVGQEFILDGNLYKVTTAIPSGSQIVVSGSSANCELADTVTEQINEIGGNVVSLTGITFNNNISYTANSTIYKDNNFVYFSLIGVPNTDFPNDTILASGLPTPLLPSGGVMKYPMVTMGASNPSTGDNKGHDGIVTLTLDGQLKVNVPTINASGAWLIIHFIYRYA